MTAAERDRAAERLERLAAWIRTLPAADDRPPARLIHYRIGPRTACGMSARAADVRSHVRPAFITCARCARAIGRTDD